MFKKTVFRVRRLLSMFEMCVEVVHSSRKCSLGPREEDGFIEVLSILQSFLKLR